MFGCECWCWDTEPDFHYSEPQPFSLPSPLPPWPKGQGFGTGRISLGEIEVAKITKFESVCSLRGKPKVVSFYKPVDIPEGFSCLGHYCQPNDQPLRGYVLVAREAATRKPELGCLQESESDLPPLKKPVNYSLIWNADSYNDGCGYLWLPNPPIGYRAMGFVVTNNPEEPKVDEIRCVREDLTETCETSDVIFSMDSKFSKDAFRIWSMTPCERGMWCQGVPVGTFFCSSYSDSEEDLCIGCLKNVNSSLDGMPNLNQVHALIQHYGPTLFFHPDEEYLPSSVQWFFKNGALLYRDGSEKGEPIEFGGSNLPAGGINDGKFWIDLPSDDDAKDCLKRGNMESSELYVHVKPALGGTFTDIAMWVFCPFNGPATLKVGLLTITLNKIGEHVGDWEHYTLRLSNFTGELWQIYFSEHSGGRWVDASDLEFIQGNKAVVYASKHGHASFPHPGTYIQGSSKLGIGARNDVARSKFFIDSSTRYQIIAAEYLGEGIVTEPCWLQYMREWGPTIVYDSRSELDKLLDLLPFYFRFSVENLIDLFPTELYGEEGPTGPKEKDNWEGDER
ncbi:Vacuolar protein sorting-associated protein [Trema orientale]|uniref:Vacuolar protein sorting-associated protein n=1 Tax=Trema orientale TaxID=63057 RepID=A0A2P5FYQ1_TREOI|nr:Vacuolar protein sorting-associated protein [Trema orientale]